MSETETTEVFDFVVIGGGTAGLVVAARLSEDATKSILVLEAGADHKNDPRIDTPGLMTTLYEDPEYDWMFMSVRQVLFLLHVDLSNSPTSKVDRYKETELTSPAKCK